MENNLSEEAKSAMQSGSGWMKFYSITMILFSGLGLLGAFYFLFLGMPESMMVGGIMLVACLISLWIHIVLVQYASGLADAAAGDSSSLGNAFSKQKLYFLISGIFAIIGIAYNLIQTINIL